jgi:hypothetical protein
MEALSPEQRVACHEAGHAVVAALLGEPVRAVWLDDDGGKTSVDHDPGDRGLEPTVRAMVILCAGTEAERLADPHLSPYGIELGASGDSDRIYKLAASVTATHEERECLVAYARAKARALIHSEEFAWRFNGLAQRLLDEGEVAGPQLDELLEGTHAAKEDDEDRY